MVNYEILGLFWHPISSETQLNKSIAECQKGMWNLTQAPGAARL